MQKRVFSLLICVLLVLVNGIVFAEAKVTDVNWGVNRRNVLRFTLDLSEKADYNISIDGNNLLVTVDAAAAPGERGAPLHNAGRTIFSQG